MCVHLAVLVLTVAEVDCCVVSCFDVHLRVHWTVLVSRGVGVGGDPEVLLFAAVLL